MNRLFLFCDDCKSFVDGGYRHGLAALRKCGLVPSEFFGPISFVKVSGDELVRCKPYWTVDADGTPLAPTISTAHSFVRTHQSHDLGVGDIHHANGDDWSDWLIDEEGALMLPRYFVERLG